MPNVEKGRPIKDRLATRDANSGAVVYNDKAGYQRAIKRKRAGRHMKAQEKRIKDQEIQIEDQSKQMETLEWKLRQLEKAVDKLTKPDKPDNPNKPK